jgi:hypothetical protein
MPKLVQQNGYLTHKNTTSDNIGEVIGAILNGLTPALMQSLDERKQKKERDQKLQLEFSQLDPELQESMRKALSPELQRSLGLSKEVKGVRIGPDGQKNGKFDMPLDVRQRTEAENLEAESRRTAVRAGHAQVKGLDIGNEMAELQLAMTKAQKALADARQPAELIKAQETLEALQSPNKLRRYTSGYGMDLKTATERLAAEDYPELVERELVIGMDPTNVEGIRRRQVALFEKYTTDPQVGLQPQMAMRLAEAVASNDVSKLNALPKEFRTLARQRFDLDVAQHHTQLKQMNMSRNNTIAGLAGQFAMGMKMDIAGAQGIATMLVDGKPVEGIPKALYDEALKMKNLAEAAEAQKLLTAENNAKMTEWRQGLLALQKQYEDDHINKETYQRFVDEYKQKMAASMGFELAPDESYEGGIFSKMWSIVAGGVELGGAMLPDQLPFADALGKLEQRKPVDVRYRGLEGLGTKAEEFVIRAAKGNSFMMAALESQIEGEFNQLTAEANANPDLMEKNRARIQQLADALKKLKE